MRERDLANKLVWILPLLVWVFAGSRLAEAYQEYRESRASLEAEIVKLEQRLQSLRSVSQRLARARARVNELETKLSALAFADNSTKATRSLAIAQLGNEHRVEVLSVQEESPSSTPEGRSQVGMTVQFRGDFPDILSWIRALGRRGFQVNRIDLTLQNDHLQGSVGLTAWLLEVQR